jgi:ribosomal protein S18 acetylase RimI-like enzyme
MSTVTHTQTDALVERVFDATIGALELASIHIGDWLGFYRSLDEDGPATPAELATATATAERYVREWLEQQAVAGILSVADPDAAAGARRYLSVLGVAPEARRAGIAEALIRPGLERCDRERTAAYLETGRPRSRDFFSQHGFEVTEELRLPGDGPPVWRMWREPNNEQERA